MKHLLHIKIVIIVLIFSISFSSCSKDDLGRSGNKADISVNLKSDLSTYNNVYFDIEDVQVRVKEDSSLANAWVSLNTINTGTHNVSELRSDSELLLVDHFEVSPTYIYEVRLVLGDNNFININNTLVNLDIESDGNNTPSNLIKRDFEASYYYQIEIHVDLDESLSFNEEENIMVLHPKLYTEIRKF
ncbi:DUF4382 domain-containing protein [Winogradskyella endarachnes]|uniref:DUF4382 domain-containing protein n=1 Tax=Winogradskyella endarachnes TaxID=2681965 RepID=A0A6L6UD26_9FLAO|nr:DUF4382 domain-containing protein [Winogradskyella endarachnes]MUU79436.1 DUF4382 domain-containing protein [Winogradskyella endarachnes]